MGLASVPSGEQRSRFLAVGLADNTVRIISLDPTDCLSPLSMQVILWGIAKMRICASFPHCWFSLLRCLPQALPAVAESLCIVEMGSADASTSEVTSGYTKGGLNLNIGLQNGVLLRTVLGMPFCNFVVMNLATWVDKLGPRITFLFFLFLSDTVTGDLSDTRTRYLGSKPVKLFRVRMQGNDSVLAMSSRTWLSYTYQNRFHLTPLSYESLEYASGFASEQCPEGIVAISTNTLRILALEKLGAVFNQVSHPLKYTPRR